MDDAEIDRLFPYQVILPPACYTGAMFRTVHAFCIGLSLADRGHVVLRNGERLSADFAVAGVGVRPTVALAEEGGLAVDHGAIVNRYLETSRHGTSRPAIARSWIVSDGGSTLSSHLRSSF